MTERYGVEQLARMDDDDIVARQFDVRNLRWLGILLAFFAVLAPALLLVRLSSNDALPESEIWVALGNSLFCLVLLLFVLMARRRPARRWPVTVWVLVFCTAQYLAADLPLTGGSWAMDGFIALLFCRFRLPERSIKGMHAFYAIATTTIALLAPLPEMKQKVPAWVASLLTLIVVLLMIAAAFGLQLAGTRRVRREILDEWREPLREARDQVRMRDELRYARAMQLAMLPDAAPSLDWIDLAGASLPAAEVGGDYYDFFVDLSTGGDRLAIVTCDVAGHGMASGLVLAAMRGGFTLLRRSMTQPTSSPAAVLEQLHDLVAHTSRRRILATAAIVIIDRNPRRATIASAGHPPVLLRRNDTIRSFDLFAPPLGVRLPVTIAEERHDLLPGDVLILHSDGIYESRNPAGEPYGLARLSAVVLRHPAKSSATTFRDAILKDVETFRGGAAQEDDVTVVVAKMMG